MTTPDSPSAGGPSSIWSLPCDESMLEPRPRETLALWFAFDGVDPHVHARHVAWEALGLIKMEQPEAFDSAKLDIWAGQRCIEGAFLPEMVLALVGLAPELAGWLRTRMQANDSFVDESPEIEPVALGAFPLARVASGRLTPRSAPVDFLIACSRRYRLLHGLASWTRDPYRQVAAGAYFPLEFAWMTLDGSIIDAEGGAIEIVENSKLTPEDIPTPDASPEDVARFAVTFDGFEEYGDYQATLDTARDVRSQHERGADLAAEMPLRELRTAVFVECLTPVEVGVPTSQYLGSLLTAIRTLVERQRARTQRLRRQSDAPTLGVKGRNSSASDEAQSRAGVALLEDLDSEEQCQLIHELLLGAGPLEKTEAIRTLASRLRDEGRVIYQRLHQDGSLFISLEEIVERCIKEGTVDRPRRGWIRAVLSDASDYSRDQWRVCLLTVVLDEPMDRDLAVRQAAEWAREHMGLSYSRLREGGVIDKGLRSAMNSAIRRGELVRVGSHSVRKAVPSVVLSEAAAE